MFKTKVFLVESSTRAHLLSNTGTFVPSQDVGNRAPKICRAPNAQRRGLEGSSLGFEATWMVCCDGRSRS